MCKWDRLLLLEMISSANVFLELPTICLTFFPSTKTKRKQSHQNEEFHYCWGMKRDAMRQCAIAGLFQENSSIVLQECGPWDSEPCAFSRVTLNLTISGVTWYVPKESNPMFTGSWAKLWDENSVMIIADSRIVSHLESGDVLGFQQAMRPGGVLTILALGAQFLLGIRTCRLRPSTVLVCRTLERVSLQSHRPG